jgi:hypothetical protein
MGAQNNESPEYAPGPYIGMPSDRIEFYYL